MNVLLATPVAKGKHKLIRLIIYLYGVLRENAIVPRVQNCRMFIRANTNAILLLPTIVYTQHTKYSLHNFTRSLITNSRH